MPEASRLAALIETLRSGSPRSAHQAGLELVSLGKLAEEPLVGLLNESANAHRLYELLGVLQALPLTQPASVATVVRLLSHRDHVVRGAAARCLLQGSPKLRPLLERIQAAWEKEKNAQVRMLLKKLLERYPNS